MDPIRQEAPPSQRTHIIVLWVMIVTAALVFTCALAWGQGTIIDTRCGGTRFNGRCQTYIGPQYQQPNARIIHVPQNPDEDSPEVEAWIRRCVLGLKKDRFGVSRYVYARPGCEYGAGE